MNPSFFLISLYLGIASAGPKLVGSLEAPGTGGRQRTENYMARMKKDGEDQCGRRI